MLKVYEDSENYTGTIVRLSNTFALPGMDNVVATSVFGNICIIPKSYSIENTYVFFPSGTALSETYLSANNLYRDAQKNSNKLLKGYFEDNSRIKAIKFKGHISSGVIMPINSLPHFNKLKVGDEFNCIDGIHICRKHIVPVGMFASGRAKQVKLLDEIIDSRNFPEHIDTSHLLKSLHQISLLDEMIITIKLHGTSGRVGHTLTKRKLKWHEKLAKKVGVKVQGNEYQYVVGSRRVIKSVGFNELKNKQHFYEEDLWTKVSKETFEGKLHEGEIIYFEVIGKDYTGAEIQADYHYGRTTPTVYVYRITHINSQGIEVDLSWRQVRQRCKEIGLNPVITDYEGKVSNYLLHVIKCQLEDLIPKGFDGRDSDEEIIGWKIKLEEYLKKMYLDKPSWLDDKVIEEGICVRIERYPKPLIFKLKSPLFLAHESKQADKEVIDVETTN